MAELRCPYRVDPAAHRDDGIGVVKTHIAGTFARTLGLNHPEFPDSCLGIDFALFIAIFRVFTYGPDVHIEQRRHQLLGQPDGLGPIAQFNALLAALRRENQKLRRAFADL